MPRKNLSSLVKRYISKVLHQENRVLIVSDSLKSILSRIFYRNKFVKRYLEKSEVIMGNAVISKAEWQERKLVELSKRNQYQKSFTSMMNTSNLQHDLSKNINFEISVIVSIYRSRDLLDLFLGNLMEQSIFNKTEVVLVLVAPEPSEIKLAVAFAEYNRNVHLEIVSSRITIYSAWNLAITKCTSPYITNMNVDDLRSPNSLEVQLKFMNNHPWVDVGYQDFFYLLDRDLDWTSVVNIGALSNSPPVTLTELAWFGLNPPHNAPIWKRDLHDKLGLFNESLKSAGDYEFWMRAVSKGAVFAKMHESTVGYYLNPDGLSTSPNSPSKFEEGELRELYRAKIKLKSEILPIIGLGEDFARNPWDGAEVLTRLTLEALKEV